MKSTLRINNAIPEYLVLSKQVYHKNFSNLLFLTITQRFLPSKKGPKELFKIALLCLGLLLLSFSSAEAQTNRTVCEGESLALTMTPPSEVRRIQWQVSTNNGIDYSDISGATATSYTVTVTSNDSNKRYRAIYETRDCVWIFCGGWYTPENFTYTTLTVNSTPSAPTAENVARCGAGTVTLTASGTTNGNYRWYTTQTGGSAISGQNNATYTTPRLTSLRTYYVATTNGACESPRIPVTAFVHSGTNAPTVNNTTVCAGSTPTLSVSSPVDGVIYTWYTTSSGGTPFHTGTTYTTPSLTANVTYYVAALNGCGTSARRAVTITVNSIPNAPITTGNSRCGNGTVTLAATGSTNGNYRWYTVATGGTAISRATNDSYTTPSLSNTTTYYVAIINGTCESPRTPVTATVNAIPVAPTVTDGSRVNTGTITLTASGAPADGSYRWYTQSTGGTAIAGATAATFVTPELSTTTDYWVCIVSSGNCESSRARVRAAITTVPQYNNLTTHVILYHENFTGFTGQGMSANGWNLASETGNANNSGKASGREHIRTNATGVKSLTLDPISTVGYEQIGIMYAHRRSNATGNVLTLQYSLDGTNWISVPNVSSPSTTWSWVSNNYIILPENASNAPNLRIRWQNTTSSGSRYYALDDITIVGTPVIGLTRFNWGSRPSGENPFEASVSNPNAYTVDGIHMKWSRETNVTTTVSGTASGVSHTQFQNTPTLALMQTGANASSNRTIVTLELSRPVEDLTFTLFDVDRESGQFRDDVEILGYNGNTTVSLSNKQVITSYIQAFSSNRILASDAYNDVATTSKDADVTVTFGSAVDRIVMTYRNASGNGNQGIGIHDLMWRTQDAVIAPLPVELVSFKATAQQNQVILNWSTASELNNDRFEVERSQDGKSFTKIGTVQGKGTSSLTHHYTFKDTNPGTGTNYYRLRQVDFDGAFEFSKTVATSIRAIAASVKAYPSPFTDYVRVELATHETGMAEVNVIDMQGRVVIVKEISIEGRYTEFELQTQQLATGIYFLKIKGANIDSTTKMIKQN